MILLDTNIVIDMINNQNDEHWILLQKDSVVLCGIIITELYRGIKNSSEEKAIELFVNSLDCLPLNNYDWKHIGLFIAELRDNGLIIPVQVLYEGSGIPCNPFLFFNIENRFFLDIILIVEKIIIVCNWLAVLCFKPFCPACFKKFQFCK